MYASGEGIPQDHAEASKWFRKAAEQGDAKAQNNLGVMHARGLGVPLDYAEAAKWFRKAADQGDGKGRENLERVETLLESQRK
jgi:TPR repeat protein